MAFCNLYRREHESRARRQQGRADCDAPELRARKQLLGDWPFSNRL